MFKFEKKLKEIGATEDQLTKVLKAEIEGIRGVSSHNAEINKKISKSKDEAEIATLTAELYDEAGIEKGDEDIVALIEKWQVNAPKVAAMQEARKAKAAAKNNPPAPVVTPDPPIVVAPIETPVVALPADPAPVVVAEQGTVVPPAEDPANGEEKKGGITFGKVITGLLVVGAAVLGIKYIRER